MARTTSSRPNIGPAVRRLRLAAGLTQSDLAALVEIAPETMSRIETARAGGVSMALAKQFADALKVPVAELFQEPREISRSKLRPGERALLMLVSRLDDAQLQDVVKLLRLVARVGRHIRPDSESAATTKGTRRPRRA